MVKCTFTQQGPDAVCTRCGRVVKNYTGDLTRLHAGCRVDEDGKRIEPKLPSMATRAKNFAGFIGRNILNRGKRRPRAEQERCLAICRACEHFNHKRKACSKCGCCVGTWRNRWLNKLAWASEDCPEGFWEKNDE